MLNVNSALSMSSIMFFYCARSTVKSEHVKSVKIMSALLRQLASSKSDLSVKEPVAKEYKVYKKRAEKNCFMLKKLTVKNCTRLILKLIKDHSATIIIDALNKCEESTHHKLLKALNDIISKFIKVVKILVFSCDDIDIISILH